MATLAIDTLKYAKRLQAAGVPQEQAEAQAETLADAIEVNLVTKQLFEEGLERLKNDLRVEVREQQSNLIRGLVPLMLGQIAAIVALVKLL
jgi:hypothetical protein